MFDRMKIDNILIYFRCILSCIFSMVRNKIDQSYNHIKSQCKTQNNIIVKPHFLRRKLFALFPFSEHKCMNYKAKT